MANLPFMLGLLWGMHDVKKEMENQEIDLNKIDIDYLIDLTRDAKIAQAPERYILDPDEKAKILKDLKDHGVDDDAILIIEDIIEYVLLNRTAIMKLVSGFLKLGGD